MKLVILESPFRADTIGLQIRNHIYLQRCILDCLRRGEAPFASHQMYTNALDDIIPQERELGIDAGLEWFRAAEAHVFYEDYGLSPGMSQAMMHSRLPSSIRRIGLNPPVTNTQAKKFLQNIGALALAPYPFPSSSEVDERYAAAFGLIAGIVQESIAAVEENRPIHLTVKPLKDW